MKGIFIALEGIDGCGKSSQINYLADWLPSSGLIPKGAKLHITREPGGTALGMELRKLLLQKNNKIEPEPITELLLYAADRAQHISQIIKPALDRGDWIISDRFSGSTIAYQGYGRKLNIDLIKQLELIATQEIQPDLTLLLNIPISVSFSRRVAAQNDRIEDEGLAFLNRVAKGFNELAKERKWVNIPGQLEQALVSKEIEKALLLFFGIR